LLQRLDNHIRGLMNHFGNDVYAWDVVNEVIDPGQPDGYRRSPWFNIIGPEYIEHAFRTAHEVLPNAKLYINDFSTTDTTKRQFLFNVISDLKSRGVPIDGIGHQMHNNVDFPSAQAIIDTVNLFAGLGVDNQITELDVSIYSGSNPTIYDDYANIPQSLFIKQSYRYRAFFDAFRQLKGKISSVTFWGLGDDTTWLNSAGRVNGPLLFDTSLQHKLAYTAIIDPSQLPGADVATTSSPAPTTVLTGHDISYTINVADITHDPASGVALTIPIPANTTFQSLSAPGGWGTTAPAVGSGGSVTCTNTSLAAGASAVFTLVVRIDCAVPDGTVISSTASVATTTADPWTPNNSSTSTVIASNPAPVVTAPADLTFQCAGQVPASNAADAVVSDNCGTPGVTVSETGNGGAGSPASPLVITRTFTATDSAGSSGSASQTITVIDNTAPVVSCPAAITVAGNILGSCGATVSQPAPTASDNCSGTINMIGSRSDALGLSAAYPLGTTTITWTATDVAGNSASCTQTITVTNPSPVANITSPVGGAFFAAGAPISFTGAFTDNPGGTHAAQWQFGSVTQAGSLSESTGAITGAFSFATPGIYTVSLTVTDGCGGSNLTSSVAGKPAIVFIFDPISGKVTCDGQIDSPPGAVSANPGMSGKATFALSCQYKSGALPPKGTTQFTFGTLGFQASSFEFLVVSGAKAAFRGVGKINGGGNFGFMLSLIDGDLKGAGNVDRLRMKIWDKNNNDAVVYDSQIGAPDTADPAAPLTSGNVTVHKP
ncbi:MAG TPA: endo-1,4-beta-xylanase, partial [Blastocatellia bacterium]|nr:endo-1,4-beta-xylanase [Blastocatellia bacterium]